MPGTWREKFEAEAQARGYTIVYCEHDPLVGWTLEFDDGTSLDQVASTVTVSRLIKKLPLRGNDKEAA